MKLIINDQEVEYISDYPLGWKISAGDPFKFPVTIGNRSCFVKRFQIKNPANISGWPLLQQLKGKSGLYLPTIFDIHTVKEKDNEISYVIYEYLEGKTLEQKINEGDVVDLGTLTSDIFNTLELIHSYGFWFADFCEKNIFCETKGRYILVDMDSAQPLTAYPDNDMYGSKDYWIPVYKFYKEILNKPQIRLQDIHGMALDYMQFMFLLLHLKLTEESNRKNYKSIDNYSALTTNLAKYDGFKELFLKLYQNKSPGLIPETVLEIKNLIQHKLISNPMDTNPGRSKGAIIHEFMSSTYAIQRGGSFILSWNVEADKIDLYRNGSLFQTLGTSQQSFEKTEFYDSDKDVTYQLVAVKNGIQARSKPVVIKCITTSQAILPSEISQYLLQSMKWAKMAGVIGIIICSIIMVISLIAAFSNNDTIIFLFAGITILFPIIFLLSFARKLKLYMPFVDKNQWVESFKILKRYFKSMGIFIIIYLIILLFLIIGELG